MSPTTNVHLSRAETWTLTTFSAACVAVLVQTIRADGAPLVASLALSGLAFSISYAWIRWTGDLFVAAGRKGKDMSKKHSPVIPETMGAISAAVFLLTMALFMPFGFYRELVISTAGAGSREAFVDLRDVDTGRFLHRFPHDKIEQYYSAICSLAFMFILGLADDIFDIRWRHKIWIPFFASIPLLLTYYGNFGVTDVVVPTLLRPYFGDLIRLGWLYYAYMACLSTFAPNCINIFAGINGIEVGQSIVIALLIVLNDCFYLFPGSSIPLLTPTASSPPPPVPSNASLSNNASFLPPPTTARLASNPAVNPATDTHLFSLYLLLPFLGVSLSLLMHNWYPARVFVGDTYCYFAGMLIAVDAILNHFSKTLLLLLVPQIFNFLYSSPQLFGLVPCPRHRLPRFNARTNLLENSWAEFSIPAERFVKELEDTPAVMNNGAHGHRRTKSARVTAPTAPPQRQSILHPHIQAILRLLHSLRLLNIETHPETGEVVRSTNFTIINLWLVWFGPRREDRLAAELLAMQMTVGLIGLVVRHGVGRLVFGLDNT